MEPTLVPMVMLINVVIMIEPYLIQPLPIFMASTAYRDGICKAPRNCLAEGPWSKAATSKGRGIGILGG